MNHTNVMNKYVASVRLQRDATRRSSIWVDDVGEREKMRARNHFEASVFAARCVQKDAEVVHTARRDDQRITVPRDAAATVRKFDDESISAGRGRTSISDVDQFAECGSRDNRAKGRPSPSFQVVDAVQNGFLASIRSKRPEIGIIPISCVPISDQFCGVFTQYAKFRIREHLSHNHVPVLTQRIFYARDI
jgi:hypothetical protein